MTRLADAFAHCKSEGRIALSAYIPAGYPDIPSSEASIAAAIAGGADFIEIGVPFSDPAADGPVIQKATAAAIANGVSVAEIFAMAKRLRANHPATPLVCMTYANIAFQMGWQGFADALADAGFDGAIVPDVPLEESQPLRTALAAAGLAWIPLVTPTTPAPRMAAIAATATGFLYVVSNVGTTGQTDPGPMVESVVVAARAAGSAVPLVVGFGLQAPDDIRRVARAGADGAIVGSALVAKLLAGATPDEMQTAVAELGTGTKP